MLENRYLNGTYNLPWDEVPDSDGENDRDGENVRDEGNYSRDGENVRDEGNVRDEDDRDGGNNAEPPERKKRLVI